MAATSPTASVSSPARVRDPFLDNARYFVMLLVVIGHSMTVLTHELTFVRGVYTFIYTFHIPVFVLISGYTARHFIGDARQVRRMISTLVLPYLLVETALELVQQTLAGDGISLHVLEPEWLTWFVAALFSWRLTTPIWLAIRWPVPVAIVVSLVGGLAPVNDVLAIPQVIGFLPFYVIGMNLRRSHFDLLVKPWVRAGAVVALAATFVVCQLFNGRWTISWLYFRDGYGQYPLDAGPLAGIFDRGALLALGLGLAACALALVPQRRAWFSGAGQRTLYCYLLHGFVILWLDHVGFFSLVGRHGLPAVAALVVAAVLVATVLMTGPVAAVFRPVFESDLRWLFKN